MLLVKFLFLYLWQQQQKQTKQDMGVTNDPVGQTHSVASSEQCFHFVLFW